MEQKVNVRSTQGAFKKDIVTMEVVFHTKYTSIWFVYLTRCGKQNETINKFSIKMGNNFEKCRKMLGWW